MRAEHRDSRVNMQRSDNDLSLAAFKAPKYWPMWLMLATLRISSGLPFRLQRAAGWLVGALLYRVMRRKRAIAARNLELCFPGRDARARAQLLRRHFSALGMSFIEMGIGWFMPIERLRRLVAIKGREHLTAAIATGRPVLLWGAHFTCIEVGVAMLTDFTDKCASLYRPQRNAMMDVLIRRGRTRFATDQIPRDDVRRMLKRLKQGYVVVYFPDQTYLGNQSSMLPFFGEPALTNTATSKLAQMSGAIVLPYFYRRRPGNAGYEVEISPPLKDFPSDDAAGDAARLFAALERFIEGAPEQYLWTYKKFKRRPAPYDDPYDSSV
jgi:KDO2-lipid IV(A) lauroyltransferase